MDAREFFKKTEGKWRSLRTTHHLPFRRAETGDSSIVVEYLEADHPKIQELCQMHSQEASSSVGGAYVTWEGSMAWDKEDENHSGSTIFALVPNPENPKAGKLLRERGYAEIVPVMGDYHVDEEEGLVLITEYETMSIVERFWFANPNLRLRTSTVKRFGGLNTATFCAEIRIEEESEPMPESKLQNEAQTYSLTGW